VNELATLLTGGRLIAECRNVIEDALQIQQDDDAYMKAQMMVTASPEFHVTILVLPSIGERDSKSPPKPPSHPNKALINFQMPGGIDSYNLLAPHSCSSTNATGETLLQQYNNERTTIAFTDEERTRIIDAVNQPCEQFAIHPDFAIAENLYNDGSLAFLCKLGHTGYQRRLLFFNSDGAVCTQYDATYISKH
jgi:hypothetical protein